MQNDRLKSRVWDKMRNAFLPKNSYYIRQDGCMSFYEFFRKKKENYDYAGEYDTERYIKQQCTGLKDKNGKLIYEGDILHFDRYIDLSKEEAEDYREEDRYSTFYIIKALNGWWFEMIDDNGGRFLVDDYLEFYLEETFFECELNSHPFLYCEIIGNIYENPELLKH